MIRYSLRCSKDHVFDSWFANAESFDKLKAAGHLECAVCGDARVEKTLMAPAVSAPADPGAKPPQGAPAAPPAAAAPGTSPATPPALVPTGAPEESREHALRKFKEHVEANTEDVGRDFARKARAMHVGDEPGRSIRGEASLEEAKGLVDDGVPIAPLPFVPSRRSN
ncbi:MAG: DUF1178 family protein [Pseudomonadota bacterium]